MTTVLRKAKDAPGYITPDGRFVVEPHWSGLALHTYRSGWKVTDVTGRPIFDRGFYPIRNLYIDLLVATLDDAKAAIDIALLREERRNRKAGELMKLEVGDRVAVFIAPLPGHRRKGDVTGQTEIGTVTRVEGVYVGVELDVGRYITTAAGYCRPFEHDVVLTEAQAAIASMSLALERGLSMPPARDDSYPEPNPLNEGDSK